MGAPMKNSRQRNAILECVMRHHDHPTADIIYQELRESFPNISLGTVYRNLSLLTSLGKIMKITCENHADRFDGQTKPHAHFECKSCGCLQDIPFKPSIHPQEEIGTGFDGIISDYTITFRGYCAKCAKNVKHRQNPRYFQLYKKPLLIIKRGSTHQLPAGLEPATYALRMRCSTN